MTFLVYFYNKRQKNLIILLTKTLNKKIILETNEKICNHIQVKYYETLYLLNQTD
ncbi:hypothetical protein BGAFAR04_E0002 (plasmid) [Borreliella garinii Far04]|nr:hypothetical protein BGAFAR04_E0002 [Borreliella garinii Far04]